MIPLIAISFLLLALLCVVLVVNVPKLRDVLSHRTLTIYRLWCTERITITHPDCTYQETVTVQGEGRMAGDSVEDAVKRYTMLHPRCTATRIQLEPPYQGIDRATHSADERSCCKGKGCQPHTPRPGIGAPSEVA